jgi:hypothetical protein
MLKEFVEQLKLYKELITIVAAGVAGAFYVAGYFATKDALTDTRKKLDSSIQQSECAMGIRITIAESTVTISGLEKQKLEKILERKELTTDIIPKSPERIKLILQQRVAGIDSDMVLISSEINAAKKEISAAKHMSDKNECSGKSAVMVAMGSTAGER